MSQWRVKGATCDSRAHGSRTRLHRTARNNPKDKHNNKDWNCLKKKHQEHFRETSTRSFLRSSNTLIKDFERDIHAVGKMFEKQE